jgi:hypothetical protein
MILLCVSYPVDVLLTAYLFVPQIDPMIFGIMYKSGKSEARVVLVEDLGKTD